MKKPTFLVTGGSGFIGSHLVNRLVKKNYKVVVPYIEIKKGSFFLENKLDKKTALIKADLTNSKLVDKIYKNYVFDFVIHLAAQTQVTKAYEDPRSTLRINVLSTINVLESARLYGQVKAIIVASSDKAYGQTNTYYKEGSPLAGQFPYDVSKSSTDLIGQSYFKTYKLPVIITRFGNVFGEGDLNFDRLIPGICEAIVKNKTFRVRSNGKYIRDYINVSDVVQGYLMLIAKYKKTIGNAYNFAGRDTLSVLNVLELFKKVLKREISYEVLDNAKAEISYQHLNDHKAKRIGWEPREKLVKKVGHILNWYENYFKHV